MHAFLASLVLLQAAGQPLPANYQLVLQTPQALVYHVHYGPHEHVAMHPHPAYPTIFIYLDQSGPIRFTHEGTPPEVTLRPVSQAGSYRVAPALAETHAVDNLGDASSDSLRVEFTHVPPGVVPGVSREPAPAHLAQDLDQVEYTNPAFSIERIVCVPNVVCTIADVDGPSIVVGLTPSLLVAPDSTTVPLDAGEVRLGPGPGARVSAQPTSGQPAHLLRIRMAQP